MKKLFAEETARVDNCQCVYCGHVFDGCTACNGDMDAKTVECPSCKSEMWVFLSIEYICTPIEDED